MVFAKPYFSTNNLTLEDANFVDVGGITVAQQFIGWIQQFGELQKTDVIITKSGDLEATKPDLQYIFHINVDAGAQEQIEQLGECIVKLLERALVLGLESINIPLLMSPDNLKSSAKQFFTELL